MIISQKIKQMLGKKTKEIDSEATEIPKTEALTVKDIDDRIKVYRCSPHSTAKKGIERLAEMYSDGDLPSGEEELYNLLSTSSTRPEIIASGLVYAISEMRLKLSDDADKFNHKRDALRVADRLLEEYISRIRYPDEKEKSRKAASETLKAIAMYAKQMEIESETLRRREQRWDYEEITDRVDLNEALKLLDEAEGEYLSLITEKPSQRKMEYGVAEYSGKLAVIRKVKSVILWEQNTKGFEGEGEIYPVLFGDDLQGPVREQVKAINLRDLRHKAETDEFGGPYISDRIYLNSESLADLVTT